MKLKAITAMMLTLLLLSLFTIPINSVQAIAQDISITWIVDTPSYKEALIVITTEDGKLDFLFEVNITHGSPAIYNITAHIPILCIDFYVGWLSLNETLDDAPIIGSITAFHLHCSAEFVKLLVLAFATVIITAVIVFIFDLLEDLWTGDLLGFIRTFLRWLQYLAPLSLVLVLLTLFGDKNPDGSVGLYFPYAPLSYVLDLLSQSHYYAATDLSWWEIIRKTWTLWIIYPIWGITFTWFEATWLYWRITPEIVNRPPMASFIWSPEKPAINTTVTFVSTSFDPDGTLVDYRWWFGDGYEAVGENATHQYHEIGTYNATLRVIDNNGSISSAYSNITVVSVIPAETDINPDTFNLRSMGEWITCYIELPEGYNVSDIDIYSIRLNDTFPVSLLPNPPVPVPTEIGDHDNDTIPDLMVKFNRTELTSHIYHTLGIEYGNVTLTITGNLTDGTTFEGKDTIKVIFGGDADLSGLIEMQDFYIWTENFGNTPEQHPSQVHPDFDDNGLVELPDFYIWRENFGATIPPQPSN